MGRSMKKRYGEMLSKYELDLSLPLEPVVLEKCFRYHNLTAGSTMLGLSSACLQRKRFGGLRARPNFCVMIWHTFNTFAQP